MAKIEHFEMRLGADASRVVIRPFHIAPEPRKSSRVKRIVDEVMSFDEATCERELQEVNGDFSERHWQTAEVYLQRFNYVGRELGLRGADLSQSRRELIGAYFCHEYSYAAAAIMNPSIVPHPDQSGLWPGDQRFVMSMRTVGEGHISSISFREGILSKEGKLTLWPQSAPTIAAYAEEPCAEGPVLARRPSSVNISGTVIFPFTQAQRNGLEDLRLVQFEEDDAHKVYYGTYTAYSGTSIGSELMTTKDFSTFLLEPMRGPAANNKGMALFPKRVDGGYAMIGRQDGESLYFLQSDDLRRWDGGTLVMAPKYPWELVQIGNCGCPIELDEGWLLLTHGVGAMRKYSIGAALLDKKNPAKVLGRMALPLLEPSLQNRDGYVPNVLYTCGGLKHGQKLFMPYGVADSSVGFALIDIPSLLEDMR
ncbi:MAG: glycoside hydrolase family 130 protein [Caulobacterales bacterium]